jgi:hypothetical protein
MHLEYNNAKLAEEMFSLAAQQIQQTHLSGAEAFQVHTYIRLSFIAPFMT